MSPLSHAPLQELATPPPEVSRVFDLGGDPLAVSNETRRAGVEVLVARVRGGPSAGVLPRGGREVLVDPEATRGEVWNRVAAAARGAFLHFGGDEAFAAEDLELLREGKVGAVVRGRGRTIRVLIWAPWSRLHPFPHVDEPLEPWCRAILSEGVAVERASGGLAEGRILERVSPAFEPLRILHVVHGFPPESGAGTEIACRTLATAQQQAGHVVRVFARSSDPTREEYSSFREVVQGLVVDRVVHHLRHPGGIRDTFVNASVERVFRRTLIEFRPDVVHVHHLIHLSAPILALARRSGAVTGVTWHDYWPLCPRVQLLRPDGTRCRPRRPLACFLCVKKRATFAIPLADRLAPILERTVLFGIERLWRTPRGRRAHSDLASLRRRTRRLRRLYSNVDFAFAPSRHLADLVRSTWEGAGTALRVVENALPHEEGRRLPLAEGTTPSPEGLRLGYFGSLVEHKGLDVLLEALRVLPREKVSLHVHGPFTPEREDYHARLSQSARDLAVTFHGGYENAEAAVRIASVDVVCMPSLWEENSPVVLLEAAAVGRPVLAPRLGGFAEKIEDGRTGFLYEPGRRPVRALRHALERVLRAWKKGDLPRLSATFRSAEHQAREVELYYRVARRLRRADRPRVVAERFGAHADALVGEHEIQGTDLLLLRPDQESSASYHWPARDPLARDRAFDAELEVELLLLGGEQDVPVGGRVYWDDVLCAEMTVLRAKHRDEVKVHRFPVRVNGKGCSVRIENLVDGRRVFTRVRRVRIVRRALERGE